MLSFNLLISQLNAHKFDTKLQLVFGITDKRGFEPPEFPGKICWCPTWKMMNREGFTIIDELINHVQTTCTFIDRFYPKVTKFGLYLHKFNSEQSTFSYGRVSS